MYIGNYSEYLKEMGDTDYNEPLNTKQKEEAFNKGFKICNDIFKRYTKWI